MMSAYSTNPCPSSFLPNSTMHAPFTARRPRRWSHPPSSAASPPVLSVTPPLPAAVLRPAPGDGDQHLEQHELVPRLEAVEGLVVVSNDVVRVQQHLVARRMTGDEDLVAHAVRLDHDVIGTARDDATSDGADHRGRSPA